MCALWIVLTSRVAASAGAPFEGGVLVRGAATLAGAVASAVVAVDRAEHERRSACGLGAVTSLPLLDALMCLPCGAEIPESDVGGSVRETVASAPTGCAERLPGSVLRRLAVPAAAVPLVVVEYDRWGPALARAASFSPVAASCVLMDRRNIPETRLWEADAAGVGVWARGDGGAPEQLVAPAPFVQRYFKPAGWRFRERAYAAWLTTKRP